MYTNIKISEKIDSVIKKMLFIVIEMDHIQSLQCCECSLAMFYGGFCAFFLKEKDFKRKIKK